MEQTDFLSQIHSINENIFNAIKDTMKEYDTNIIDFTDEEDYPFVLYYFMKGNGHWEDCAVTKIELKDNNLILTISYEDGEYEIYEDYRDFWTSYSIGLYYIYDAVLIALGLK